MEGLPRLTQDNQNLCEGPLTFDECAKALSSMKDNKAPGCDGLPAEFYKKYFNVIGHQFVQVVNSNPTHLAESHRLSIIPYCAKIPTKPKTLTTGVPYPY
jgi:hypothetical protein